MRYQPSQRVIVALFTSLCLLFIFTFNLQPAEKIISPIISNWQPLQPIKEDKANYEVFGFAPYWTFNNLDNVDFSVLTTLAYFSVEVDANGDLIKSGPGYGYNHMVYSPEVKAATRPYSWRGRAMVQTYSIVQENIHPDMPEATDYKTGWDGKHIMYLPLGHGE